MVLSKMEGNILIGKMQRIMNLRAKGYAVNFDFPSIVVIGSQSSGKSSVIESIVGRHFLPRGTNMVTRCPIVINLYHAPDLETDYAKFSPTDNDPQPKSFQDFNEIRTEIQRRMNIAANGKNISDKMITLNIYSEHYPNNLQLIDLPGFVRNHLPDQPENIREQIEDLARKFIEKENTIILAVSDSNVDIADSAGIAEARKADQKGIRTVGVLTKCDLIPKERHSALMDLLNNKLLPLSKGYVAVINPPNDNGEEESILGMREKEMHLFQKLAAINSHKLKNYGTEYLQRKLSRELSQKIREKIPELIVKVNEELELTQQEIDSLDYKNEIDVMPVSQRLMKKLKVYENAVVVMLRGNDRFVSHTEIQGGARLKMLLKEEMKKTCKEAMKLNPQKFGKDIEVMLENLDATYDNVLPNSLAFQNCVSILVEKFKKPMSLLIATFSENLNSYLRKCADDTLSLVPNLKQKIIEMSSEKVSEFRELCKEDMNRNIDIQKTFINYGHPEFQRYENLLKGKSTIKFDTDSHKEQDEEFKDAENGEENGKDEIEGREHYYTFDEDDSDKNIKWIKQKANAFIHFQKDIVNKRKLGVPFDTKSRKDFFLEIVLAYMLILETILYDTGIKLIMYHLVHNVINFHQGPDMFVALIENTGEKINEFLQIDEYKREKLENLLEQRESYHDVLKVLRDSD